MLMWVFASLPAGVAIFDFVLRLTWCPRRRFSIWCPSDYEYCRIDGNTPHDTRQDLIEEYNAPVRKRVALP